MNLLFQSRYFSSYQSDKDRRFIFDFGNKVVHFSFCQLLAFRQNVIKIDLDAHFTGENKHGIEILILCNREHILVFDTHQVVDLKEFIKGTFAMLELNSMVV